MVDQLLTLESLYRILELSALILIARLVAAAPRRRSAYPDWHVMPASFVVNFTSLLLFGPYAAMVVAAVGSSTELLAHPRRLQRRMLEHAAIVTAALLAAGAAHRSVGGIVGQVGWPLAGLSIAAAVITYCVIASTLADIVAPILTKQAMNRSWPQRLLSAVPTYIIGAGVAASIVALVDDRAWQVVPVVAIPLYFLYRSYNSHLIAREEDDSRREVVDSLNHGMAIVDDSGLITLWDGGAERMFACSREHAIGHTIASAVPALGNASVSQAITQVQNERLARKLTQLRGALGPDARALEIRIVPVSGGVALLCQDVTEHAEAEQALRRSEGRLALAAEGANDGLWQLDLRNKEFYVSARWKAMLGLPAVAGAGQLEDWIDRVHPDDIAPLKEKIEACIAGKENQLHCEHRIRHEDGTFRLFLSRGVLAAGSGRRPVRIAGSLTDTTEHGRTQDQLRSVVFLDPLTGLCNRAVFVEALGLRLEQFKSRKVHGRFATLYLDLDRLKVVNDSLGHPVGDELLTAVAKRLQSCLRPGDLLARLGGDEFGILLNEIDDETQANAVAFRIQESLGAPFSVGGRELFASASIGIAVAQAEYATPDEIMRDADTALYHAKARGKARHELFDADMRARELDRVGFENDLRHAIDGNAFEMQYQPIVLLASGMCVGFESLIRWTRDGKRVPPATFIPLAEELGLMEPLGTWVLQQACSAFAGWQRRFPGSGLDHITVNVSSRQLMQQNFLRIVEDAVQTAGLQPCQLRLEITETALMDSPREAAKLLSQLREFGTKIYLDDFGCGYSSLSHLHTLPVDALKIDRSFVTSLLLPDRPAIVESILALARTLKTNVVAEGIEDIHQAADLERLGCTHAQGYLFSRPLSVSAVEELLAAKRPLGPARIPKPFEWPENVQVG
jgi:diguanylate cyclase (GGDEF)-like protein/PAS domain S-box-containing protein